MNHCAIPSVKFARILLLLLVSNLPILSAMADSISDRICAQPNSSFLLADAKGKPLASCRADRPLVPASTLKILTAWLALNHWGSEYRFQTEFFVDDRKQLWIKGYGDPMLVSEELERIAAALSERGLKACSALGIDESYFDPDIKVPGRSSSDNPYDAHVAALAVNFNTVNLLRENGQLRSAEPQTALTETAQRLGANLTEGLHRISLPSANDSGRYFAEQLRLKLADAGITCGQAIIREKVPASAHLIYRHLNSVPLEEIVRAMLEYSNNFIANQLLLTLAADVVGPPATLEKGIAVARQRIDSELGWKNYHIEEAAGLSRNNRISARQLVALLERFEPWSRLLSTRRAGVPAKTGTLNGIRTLAGYLGSNSGAKRFAILINDPAPVRWSYRLLRQWQQQFASE